MKLLMTEIEMKGALQALIGDKGLSSKVAKVTPTWNKDYPYELVFEGDPSLDEKPEPTPEPEAAQLPAVAEKDDHF